MKPRATSLWDLLASEAAAPAPLAGLAAHSEAALRESIRQELGLLFNSTALAAGDALEHWPHAGRSTLNYGLPNLAGNTATSIDPGWLAAQLTRAIRRFEPRLLAESVQVRVRPPGPTNHNVLSFEIDAAFQHAPDADSVQFDSQLDLESGRAQVVERPRAVRAAN